MYNTQSKAEWNGKRDPYCKAVGGFAVFLMPGGKFDYFPYGQPPQQDGRKVMALRVSRWSWNYHNWIKREETEEAYR